MVLVKNYKIFWMLSYFERIQGQTKLNHRDSIKVSILFIRFWANKIVAEYE